MHLCVVSPFPPELTGVGQYGWNVVRGLAASGDFSAITILAQQSAEPDPPEARLPTSLVRVRRVWARDDMVTALQLARQVRAERPDVAWFNLGYTVFGASRSVNFLGLLAPYVARRLGGLLSAAHQGGLSFADISDTAKVADGLTPLTATRLTRILMPRAEDARVQTVSHAAHSARKAG